MTLIFSLFANQSLHSITSTNYQLLSANLPPHALHTNHPVDTLSHLHQSIILLLHKQPRTKKKRAPSRLPRNLPLPSLSTALWAPTGHPSQLPSFCQL
ncbi:hypothetical protein ES319_D04G165900v1 [Gossypium barbadense]|uniref:Uncharacterized protein n=1 Tax=Gossypium barbadense TaxID=3634 RepID=A0A5J5S136_GOSBA|nr:hypothetical protein ES319_D04G165900v1 [Gossypium barbadense]